MEKWKPVMVSLSTSEQRPDGGVDGPLRVLLPGELKQGDGDVLLRYNESVEEDSAATTQVHMRLRPGQMTMIRSGDFGTTMVFSRGKRFEGSYHTPYGDIPLALYTTRMSASLGEAEGSASLEYRLELDGSPSVLHRIQLSYYRT